MSGTSEKVIHWRRCMFFCYVVDMSKLSMLLLICPGRSTLKPILDANLGHKVNKIPRNDEQPSCERILAETTMATSRLDLWSMY